MAKKKVDTLIQPKSKNGSGEAEATTLLYDEWIVPQVLRIRIDMLEILQDMELYQIQLMNTRGIPQQPDGFSVDDPNINIAMDFYSHIKDERKREAMVIEELKSHYSRLASEMQGFGFMLAALKTNELDNEPAEYTPDWATAKLLPGLATLPSPIPDIRYPVEHRLKQILDILQANPGAFAEIQKRFDTIRVTINQRMKLGRDALPGESS